MMIELGGIRAVTLDVGGTMMEPWPSVGRIYADVAGEHGVKAAEVDRLDRQFAEAWRGRKEFDYSQGAWFELVRRTFGDLAGKLPEAYFPAVYERFATPEVWRVHEDVVPVLESLAGRGIALGIVSNWDERLKPLLKALKLHSYFDAVIVSCEIGFTKPSPVIFEQVVRKLGLPAEAILHVGDSAREDVAGARGAGLKALQLVRRGGVAAGQIATLRALEAVAA
jgi:putative hydrolase of the HAD superfamily